MGIPVIADYEDTEAECFESFPTLEL